MTENPATPITGAQCRAARALVALPRERVALDAGVGVDVLATFESGLGDPDDAARQRLRRALEAAGAVFIDENGGGIGVRLRFSRKDVRGITRWEGEGGQVGDDDV